MRRIENLKSDDARKSMRMRNDDDYCDVLPGDNDVIRSVKAQNVGKLKQQQQQQRRDVNEKFPVDVRKVASNEGGVSVASAACSIWNSDKSARTTDSRAANIALGRCRECLTKISEYLDYVHEICEFPPEMEDIIDLKRRQKRSTEFASRFARNHLYQIGRIVSFFLCFLSPPLECVFTYRSTFFLVCKKKTNPMV